jgi:hypothetical protein
MARFIRTLTSVVLSYLGLKGSTRYTITWVDGFARPKVIERATTYYYTTPGGRPVHYPSAYRRAWGRPVYHCATKGTIRVGRGWALGRAIKA